MQPGTTQPGGRVAITCITGALVKLGKQRAELFLEQPAREATSYWSGAALPSKVPTFDVGECDDCYVTSCSWL